MSRDKTLHAAAKPHGKGIQVAAQVSMPNVPDATSDKSAPKGMALQ